MLSLALKQLRHFYASGCSFAKIAIPCTIYPSLNLLAFLSISVVLQICFDKKRLIQLSILKKTSHKLQSALIHRNMNQGSFYILMDEALTKSLL